MLRSVLLVEDQDSTRERLASAIEAHHSLQLVGSAECFKTALALLHSTQPEVLLTDIHLPDGNGIDLIQACQKIQNCQSMVITVFGDESHVIQAIQAGAQGYMLKDSAPEQIGSAVIEMLEGGSPISPAIARYLLKHFKPELQAANPQSRDLPDLTRREQEVLGLIAKGYSYGEIANKLFLSIHTVNSHILELYRKLSVGSRGAAVYEATQLGLIRKGN